MKYYWSNKFNCIYIGDMQQGDREATEEEIKNHLSEPEPTQEEIIEMYEIAVQRHLDSTAQSRGYDNTYTCLSYLSSTDPIWNRESNAFNAWRDKVWRKCHEILNAVMSGTIQQPTVDDLISQLPVIDWNDQKEENNSENI